jgi:hypothetical protein
MLPYHEIDGCKRYLTSRTPLVEKLPPLHTSKPTWHKGAVKQTVTGPHPLYLACARTSEKKKVIYER